MIHGTQETTYQLQEISGDGSCIHTERIGNRQDAFNAARALLAAWPTLGAVNILATDWNLREIARINRY
jgi:hypothetical protein